MGPAVEALERSAFPEYSAKPLPWQPGHQLDEPDRAALRLIALTPTSEVVGYGAIRVTGPHRYRLNLLVDPGVRGEGIGSALYERLVSELRSLGAVAINARARDDQAVAIDFLRQRGFDEVHRMRGMVLRLEQVDAATLEPFLEPLSREEIFVTNLQSLREHDPAWRVKLHALRSLVREGWPDFDPTVPQQSEWTLADFNRLVDEIKEPRALLIAQQGDTWIGLVGDLGTAVHPDWRGRGLGTALKALQAIEAKAAGKTRLFSNSAHPAIWRINRRLGYESWFAEVRLIKRL